MKRDQKKHFYLAAFFFAAFVLWTAAACLVDVRPIGPQGSLVGFAVANRFFHELTGVHMFLYTLTDWLSLVPLMLAGGFALLGVAQWIRRGSLKRVDGSLFVLGGFYLAVIAVYGLFECWVVNYRPVLIEGVLEASYPSSTTMLVMCVMPTAVMQLNGRIANSTLRKGVTGTMIAFTVFMVVGRLLSGVHWLTDIIGGGLISTGLVMTYEGLVAGLRRES